jgi:putative solute:sodium symporter small subunit
MRRDRRRAYWRRNLLYLAVLLAIWFAVSFGAGILFVDELDRHRFGGFKLGFWFAQQGSIYVFVLLTFAYVFLMNRLDRRLGREEREEGEAREERESAEEPEPGRKDLP